MKTKRIYLLLFVLCAHISMHADNFRFALMTDIHISSNPIAREDLTRSVQQINATSGLDFVIISGDLTNTGDRPSLLFVKETLDQLTIPYYIVSGNHEGTWSASGVMDFTSIFGSERFNFKHKGFCFLGFPTGPILRMSDGHVSPQDISWLQEQLAAVGKKQPVFLITHYPMQSGDIDNWYAVLDAVRPYQITAFLGGHYHSNKQLSYEGIPGFLNRSNLRAKEKVGGYSIYAIEGDTLRVYEQKIGGLPTQWAAIDWTAPHDTAGQPYARPDYSVNSKYNQVAVSWQHDLPYAMYASPFVHRGKVYVGDDEGTMHAMQVADGSELWSFHTGARIVGQATATDKYVAFGSADSCIYALNAATGALHWKIKTDAAVLGGAVCEQGTVYIGGSDHSFKAIDLATGTIRWNYSEIEGYIQATPLVYDGKVVFGAWDGCLYALDKSTGTLAWKWRSPRPGKFYSPAAVWPVGAHGKIFIVDPYRAMTAIDAKQGTTVWRTKQSKVRESIGLSKDGKRIFAKTMQDSVVCYSALTEQPVEVWATSVGFGYEHASSMLFEQGGTVVGSTKNGLLFALNSFNGKIEWLHKNSNSLINAILPVDKNHYLFNGSAGQVVLLQTNKD